jgi:hypothetical protein
MVKAKRVIVLFDDSHGEGKTVQEAYDSLCLNTDAPLSDCTFYEAVEVEVALVPKETLVVKGC